MKYSLLFILRKAKFICKNDCILHKILNFFKESFQGKKLTKQICSSDAVLLSPQNSLDSKGGKDRLKN
jgi:hypothetical protein